MLLSLEHLLSAEGIIKIFDHTGTGQSGEDQPKQREHLIGPWEDVGCKPEWEDAGAVGGHGVFMVASY